MSKVTIYGVPPSSYVRTARLALEEKGVPYEFEAVKLDTDEYKQRHPWSKVPAFQHGDLRLFETSAICRYVDAAFDGPALQPASAADRAVQDQWISVIDAYIYASAIKGYAFCYILPSFRGEPPDLEGAKRGVAALEHDFGQLEKAYAAGGGFLAGGKLSLADLFVVPIVQTVGLFPEGKAVLEKCPSLRKFQAAFEQRDSFKKVQPR